MKKPDFAQSISIFANIGVITSIIFLALQVNQANKLAETQAQIFRLDQMQQASVSIAESQYLPEILVKVQAEGFQSLSPTERLRLSSWENSVALRMQGHYYQYQQGYVDAETANIILRAAVDNLADWAELDVEISDPEFRRIVEAAAGGD